MITVILDNEDISSQVENIAWSNSDPGGCEAASFSLDHAPAKGAPVTIVNGSEPVWAGRVDGPDRELNNGKGQVGVSCVGDRAKLSDGVMAMIYLDRRLDQWNSVSTSRKIVVLALPRNSADPSVTPDPASGQPELRFAEVGPFNATQFEGMYDAGPVARVAKVYGSSLLTAFASLTYTTLIGSDDGGTTTPEDAGFPVPPATVTFTLTTARRYIFVTAYYDGVTPALTSGREYAVRWRNLLVVGNHGLALAGTTAVDFNLGYDKIAADAARRAGLAVGQVDTAQPNLQAVYLEEVPHESIVDEQAKLAGGYHWGVWPRSGPLASGSEFWFTRPPLDATVFVGVEDIDAGNLTERMSTAFSEAHVTYTDGAGSVQSTTVTRTSRILDRQTDRVLQLDAGLTTLAAAQVFGLDVLALTDIANRASGSLELPDDVFLPNGGTKPASLLRAGVDRLRVNGLSSGPLYRDPGDTFRISRISCEVQADGSVRTTAEVDSGADLVEVLNARSSQAALLSGS